MLDIIIPVLNEEKILNEKSSYFNQLKTKAFLIFVDGGSTDKTPVLARQYGKVIPSLPGRGIQKNEGVLHAQSENLLFLHVDTTIDISVIDKILEALNQGIYAGCLHMSINDPGRLFEIFAKFVNLRGKYCGIIDGDLGMFIKKVTFETTGRFEPLPYMEDIAFSKELKKYLKPVMLPYPIHVSSRKWHEQGFFRTFLCYFWAYMQLSLGRLK